jgi:hypothetical protein
MKKVDRYKRAESIRKLFAEGVSRRQLVEMFNCSYSTISRIINEHTHPLPKRRPRIDERLPSIVKFLRDHNLPNHIIAHLTGYSLSTIEKCASLTRIDTELV